MKRIARLLAVLSVFIAALLAWVAQPLLWSSSSAPSGLADPERLHADVVKLTDGFPKRYHFRPGTLSLVSRHLQERFAVLGARVEIQEFQVGGMSYSNVIAHFGPAQGAPIIIGAHYDAEEETPGADDNASGVAGLLELARLLAQKPPTVPVQLVAYSLEEPPHFASDDMGSRHHAARLAQQGIKPRLVMVLEMIGYFDDTAGSQSYPMPLLKGMYPDAGNFIAVVGRFGDVTEVRAVTAAMTGASSLPVWSINAPTWVPGVDFSDHASYWSQDIPAVMITDTAFYRNREYHKAGDTPERLDYPRMAKVVDGVLAVVRATEQEAAR
jgi:hypothetical protein